jgi:hypothetical protein
VSDPITLARSAREALSKGLNSLQSDPSVPAQLVELGAPIAQAMGALHQIEKNAGTQIAPFADDALTAMRKALGQMQAHPNPHPAVVASMESVAASLGLVHQLSKIVPQAAAVAPTAPQGVAAVNVPRPVAQPVTTQPLPSSAPHFPVASKPPQAPPAAPQVQAQPQAKPPAPVQVPAASAQAQPDPFARPAAPAPAPAPASAVPRSGTSIPSPPTAGGAAIDAALGAHSPTNFYKGLSGNDIIEHGGLFVATYMIPKIGAPVRLRIALPGGYEFEANAVVKWSRETGDPFGDSQPGFGAQFIAISPEARQLVYRYVRNREPLFHDDL